MGANSTDEIETISCGCGRCQPIGKKTQTILVYDINMGLSLKAL